MDMEKLRKAADEFMKLQRFGLAGASRKGDTAGNVIYKKLRERGYEIYPIHPSASEIEGDMAWHNIDSVPAKLEGLIIATPPEAALELVQQCHELGINHVWMHRSFGQGSVDAKAVEYGRENGIKVIPGGCPLMFNEPVDIGHKCIRWLAGVSGNLQEPVERAG